MRLSKRIHATFTRYANDSLFTFFFRSSIPFFINVEANGDLGLKNAIEDELVKYPSWDRKTITYGEVYRHIKKLSKCLERRTKQDDMIGLSIKIMRFGIRRNLVLSDQNAVPPAFIQNGQQKISSPLGRPPRYRWLSSIKWCLKRS